MCLLDQTKGPKIIKRTGQNQIIHCIHLEGCTFTQKSISQISHLYLACKLRGLGIPSCPNSNDEICPMQIKNWVPIKGECQNPIKIVQVLI